MKQTSESLPDASRTSLPQADRHEQGRKGAAGVVIVNGDDAQPAPAALSREDRLRQGLGLVPA
ncbi:hypothetical protein ACX5I6_11375 [Arthrobacter sp. MMS24-T111]